MSTEASVLPDPQARLNMLFSATLSHRVLELAYEHMNEPTLVRLLADTLGRQLQD